MSLFVVDPKKSIWAFDSVIGEIGQTTWVWFGLNHICHLMVGRDRSSGRRSGCLKLGLVPFSQTHNHRVWECEGTLCTGGGHGKGDLDSGLFLGPYNHFCTRVFLSKGRSEPTAIFTISNSPLLGGKHLHLWRTSIQTSTRFNVWKWVGWLFLHRLPYFLAACMSKDRSHPTISLPWGFF